MTLDLTKPVQTRDGRRAAVVQGPNGQLYGWFEDDPSGDHYRLAAWESNGLWAREYPGHPNDLINAPEKRTVRFWANVYPNGRRGEFWLTREAADIHAAPEREACLEFTREYVVGEGLVKP